MNLVIYRKTTTPRRSRRRRPPAPPGLAGACAHRARKLAAMTVGAAAGEGEASGIAALSKTERRRLARARKKEKLDAEKREHKRRLAEAKKRRKAQRRKEKGQGKGMSHEDRRAKFMRFAGYDTSKLGTKALGKKRCFHCGGRHTMSKCPKAAAGGDARAAQEICFNCGSNDHSLKDCRDPVDMKNLRFATCFMCGEQGHITRFCPKNENGIYRKGGACHVCGSKTHLSRDCPEKAEERADGERKRGAGFAAADAASLRGDDDGVLAKPCADQSVADAPRKRRKTVVF